MAISFNFGEVGNAIAFIIIVAVPIILLFALVRKINLKASAFAQKKKRHIQETSIGPYLESRFNSADFDSSGGLDEEKYRELGFFMAKRGFSSTSTLKVNNNLTIYDVRIEYHDADEPATHIFNGFLSKTKLERNSDCYILIKDRWLIESLLHPQRKADYITGNKGFDKKYSIKTNNIDTAKRFLSPALQEFLLEKRSSHLKLDVVILNDFLYVSNQRISPIDYNIFKEAVDSDILENIGNEIETTISVSSSLKKIIDSNLERF